LLNKKKDINSRKGILKEKKYVFKKKRKES
jgi:hypothetical protein